MKKMIIRKQHWLLGLMCLILATVLVLPQIAGVSAWSGDPTVNTAICTASGDQSQSQIISDGAGGTIITWQDSRNGNNDIYAQRVDSSGAVLWTADGVAICTNSTYQGSPRIVSDGTGGAIITWQDSRSGNNDIYAQRVNSSGAVQWTADGVPVSTASADQDRPRLVSDGAGGAIVTWEDGRVSQNDIYAQRVNSSGAVLWTADGVAICTASSFQHAPEIISDEMGGATISWYDLRSSPTMYDIYAQRVDSNGAALWTGNGVLICNAADNQVYPQLISDSASGAIITWQDYRSGSGYDIYARRVNSSGSVLWTANGVPICTASEWQTYPELVSDGSGGAIITWYDNRNGNTNADIYALRVDSNGAAQSGWTANGVPICTASLHQQNPQLIPDGAGGAIITWQDSRSGSSDIYAQRVNSGGAVQWTDNGSVVCTASGAQYNPQLISDGSAGAIITWYDYRSGSSDIYAQRVDANGNLITTPTSPKASSQTRLASSHRTSNYGQSVTFTATVRAHRGKSTTLTGTVTFKDGATIIASDVPLVGNKATFTTTALTLGSHTITAVYNGDDNFSGSTSSRFNQRVRQARHSTGVTLSINP